MRVPTKLMRYLLLVLTLLASPFAKASGPIDCSANLPAELSRKKGSEFVESALRVLRNRQELPGKKRYVICALDQRVSWKDPTVLPALQAFAELEARSCHARQKPIDREDFLSICDALWSIGRRGGNAELKYLSDWATLKHPWMHPRCDLKPGTDFEGIIRVAAVRAIGEIHSREATETLNSFEAIPAISSLGVIDSAMKGSPGRESDFQSYYLKKYEN